jgi:hypothetical protein
MQVGTRSTASAVHTPHSHPPPAGVEPGPTALAHSTPACRSGRLPRRPPSARPFESPHPVSSHPGPATDQLRSFPHAADPYTHGVIPSRLNGGTRPGLLPPCPRVLVSWSALALACGVTINLDTDQWQVEPPLAPAAPAPLHEVGAQQNGTRKSSSLQGGDTSRSGCGRKDAEQGG